MAGYSAKSVVQKLGIQPGFRIFVDVALIFSSIGTAHNTAIAKYLQSKNIPQVFVGSGDQMQFMRFNGKSWERFGELQTGAE